MRAAPPLHPSIDLLGGRLAVMVAGEITGLAAVDPLARAEVYARHGILNVIDLDAALGRGGQGGLVGEICRRHECYAGGGIRSVEDVIQRLDRGAVKAILGSALLAPGDLNRPFLADLARLVPRERLVFALDADRGELMTEAWTRRSGLEIGRVIAELEPFCSEFVITAIERESTVAGPDLATLDRLCVLTHNPLQAAGGIATIGHVLALAERGLGAVLSQVIHLGELDLTAAWMALLDLAPDETVPARVRTRDGLELAALSLDTDRIDRALREGRITVPGSGRDRDVTQVRLRGHPPELHITMI